MLRSRGGSLHTRPDKQMHHEQPITWTVSAKGHPRLMKMLKRHANKKRRQRGKKESTNFD